MKNIEYKYQNYNSKYLFADAILTQYVNSIKAIKSHNGNETDVRFCKAFERVATQLFREYSKKNIIWMYILCNEFPHRNKSYTKKEIELIEAGYPVSRPSYYREVILFTNLIAEHFGLGKDYVKTKNETKNIAVPTPGDIKNYVIEYQAA